MCKITGCGRSTSRKDELCRYHARKLLGKNCSIEECSRKAVARGWCELHWRRWKTNGHPMTVQKIRHRQYGHTRTNNNGYVIEFVPGHLQADQDGKAMQHRRVMADNLNRRLYDFENVHHKNGVRDDNRLENLELWIVRQPYGQRVTDLLEWADWIISEYRDDE